MFFLHFLIIDLRNLNTKKGGKNVDLIDRKHIIRYIYIYLCSADKNLSIINI